MNIIQYRSFKILIQRSGMSIIAVLTAMFVASIVPAGQAHAGIVVVDFENNPNLPAQPNTFAAAGAMQTYTQAGVYSITGGVVLGNPTFLSSFASHGSAPNLYGTIDVADPSLLPTITLTLPTAEHVTNVSGVFFNGQNVAEDYILTAMSGGVTVGTASITLPPDSSSSDFYNFSFSSTTAQPITSVTFTTPNANANGFDFFVDTINIVPGPASSVPEPSTLALAGVFGLMGLASAWLRRERAAA